MPGLGWAFSQQPPGREVLELAPSHRGELAGPVGPNQGSHGEAEPIRFVTLLPLQTHKGKSPEGQAAQLEGGVKAGVQGEGKAASLHKST